MNDVVILKGGMEGFKVTILHVVLNRRKRLLLTSTEKEKWLTQYREKIDTLLKGCWQI